MRLLTHSIIKNYLANFDRFTDIKNQYQAEKTKFTPAITLAVTLSTLLQKFRHLMLYIVFQKDDYSSLILPYISKNTFIDSSDVECFRSITFLECLFKTGCFSLNSEELLVLIKVLTSQTGVTFARPDDPETVLDVSTIIVHQLLDILSQQLDNMSVQDQHKQLLTLKSSITVSSCTRVFFSIWKFLDSHYSRSVFIKYYKDKIMKLLDQVMSFSVGWSMLRSYGVGLGAVVDSNLHLELSRYYNDILSKSHLDSDVINLIKQYKYRDFLQGSELTGDVKNPELWNNAGFQISQKMSKTESCTVDSYINESENMKWLYPGRLNLPRRA